jgi:hypothetical protein
MNQLIHPPGDSPDEIGIAGELVALEQELANHEAAALSVRKRIAELAPHVDARWGAMLAQQDDIDEWLADPKFDAESFAKQLRRKTDQMRYVVEDLMVTRSDGLKAAAKPLASKASAIANNRMRLRAAIVEEMKLNHFDRVPGIVWAVRLRDSNPSLQIDRPATVEDHAHYPGYVIRESTYSWNTDRILDELKAGIPLPVADIAVDVSAHGDEPMIQVAHTPLPARLSVGQWPEFVPQIPEKLEKKKKARIKK